MQESAETTLFRSLKRFLIPIARTMLRCNIDARQFIELVKLSFVEVATEEYGIRNRKTNGTRVAIMVGLTRKDVVRLQENYASDTPFRDVPKTYKQRFLDKWRRSYPSHEGDENVARLSLEGDGSVMELCDMISGDISAPALRKELIRSRHVEQAEDGMYRLAVNNTVAADFALGFSRMANQILQPAATIVDRQLNDETSDKEWPEVVALVSKVADSDLEPSRQLSRKVLQGLSKDVSEFYEALRSVRELAPGDENTRIGVVAFHYEVESP